MASGTRFLDHPTNPTLWIIDEYADLEDEGKVSVAQTSQPKSLGMQGALEAHRRLLEPISYYPPPGIKTPSKAP